MRSPIKKASQLSRGATIAMLAALTGCGGAPPDLYAPPMDRKPLSVAGNSPIGMFVNMNDGNADGYLVRDIAKRLETGTWRWTRQNPELRFFLGSNVNLKFAIDFAIAGSTFPETGPVTVSYFINGQPLDKATYDHAGAVHFEKPVPPAMLQPRAFNDVSLRLDKVWISKVDGAQLGLILTRAGFVR